MIWVITIQNNCPSNYLLLYVRNDVFTGPVTSIRTVFVSSQYAAGFRFATSGSAASAMEITTLLLRMCLENFFSKFRRNSRPSRSSRPASFPGPRHVGTGSASVTTPTDDVFEAVAETAPVVTRGASVSMKPPRQSSSVADEDDTVCLDGFTYRHMLQDITSFKTMLLKLKRTIQEVSLNFFFLSCLSQFQIQGGQWNSVAIWCTSTKRHYSKPVISTSYIHDIWYVMLNMLSSTYHAYQLHHVHCKW